MVTPNIVTKKFLEPKQEKSEQQRTFWQQFYYLAPKEQRTDWRPSYKNKTSTPLKARMMYSNSCKQCDKACGKSNRRISVRRDEHKIHKSSQSKFNKFNNIRIYVDCQAITNSMEHVPI